MKVDISPYLLQAHSPLNAVSTRTQRHGALLKVTFPRIGVGYADCHPWPELGDEPLALQLSLLAQGIKTSLMQKSLFFAKKDALARAHKLSLFSQCLLPKNHFTCVSKPTTDELEKIKNLGFQKIKIKLGRHFEEELLYLKKILPVASQLSLSLRLDYNESLNTTQAHTLCELLASFFQCIDFIEDPVSYNPQIWGELKTAYPVLRFAVDKAYSSMLFPQKECDFFIIKPALHFLIIPEIIQFIKSNDENFFSKIIVTSYFDHPLGQLSAMSDAVTINQQMHDCYKDNLYKNNMVCGLLTQHIYQTNAYSEQLTIQDTRLIPPPGTGFGFDELLEKERWQKWI